MQQLHKYRVDGLRCGYILTSQGVGVNAVCVHIFGVTYKRLDLTSGQRLDCGNKAVPQFVQADRLQIVSSSEHFPALIKPALCFQTEHAFTMPGNSPLGIQDGFCNIGQNE